MGLYDFATVQVYQSPDFIEVVFPYNPDFIAYLKSIKGRWNPNRKCWTVKESDANKNTQDMIYEIEQKLYEISPKGWKAAVSELKKTGCVIKGYEIFPGAGGIRLELPPGHPSHYALKEIKGLLNNGDKWAVPSNLIATPDVKKVISRILKEDKNKYFDWMEPSEGRCVIGSLKIAKELEEVYNFKEGSMIAVTKAFMKKADPGLSDSPTNEFAFEITKITRKTDEEVKVRLEYPDLSQGYEYLRSRVYNLSKTKSIDVDLMIDDWIQKRA